MINLNFSRGSSTSLVNSKNLFLKKIISEGQDLYCKNNKQLSPSIPNQIAVKVYQKKKMKSKLKQQILDNEYDVLSRISHPNIIRFYCKMESEKQIHFLMEYFKGHGLDYFIRRFAHKRLPLKMSKPILCQLLRTLIYLHQHDIYHRGINT